MLIKINMVREPCSSPFTHKHTVYFNTKTDRLIMLSDNLTKEESDNTREGAYYDAYFKFDGITHPVVVEDIVSPTEKELVAMITKATESGK